MVRKINAHLKIASEWILATKAKKIMDIGTDHGYLPLHLVRKNPQLKIWATDINPQIIKKLKSEMQDIPQIQTLCCDGVPVNWKEKIDLLVITGLGNVVICYILNKTNLKINNYLFQTNDNPYKIRQWVQKKKLHIEKELIIEEKKQFYHTLLINRKKGKKISNEEELIFGPYLLKKKSNNFQKWWKKELEKRKKFVNQITQIPKKKQIKLEINLIEKKIKKTKINSKR